MHNLLDDSGRQPSSRSIGHATEADTKRALSTIKWVCEWHALGHTFIRSDQAQVIARVDSLGADVHAVMWAWKYDNIFGLMIDWLEIGSLPEARTFKTSRE